MGKKKNVTSNDFDKLYSDLSSFFKTTLGGQFNPASVPTLTRYAMECLQTGLEWKGMSGSEKKNLVLGVVIKFVKDLVADPDVTKNLDANAKTAILASLDLIPVIIDVAVDFAKTYSANANTPGAPPGSTLCGCF